MELLAGFNLALKIAQHVAETLVPAVQAGHIERANQGDADPRLESHQRAEINQFPASTSAAQFESLKAGVRGAGRVRFLNGSRRQPQSYFLELLFEIGLIEGGHRAPQVAPALVHRLVLE